MTKRNEIKTKFPGFPENYIHTFWKYPRMLEGYWYMLSGSEQKILDFILRQTVGFGNDSDKISMSQFMNGYKDNKGTGLDKKTILKAIKGLVEKGFIWRKGERYRLYRYGLVMLNVGVKNTPNNVKNTPKEVKNTPKRVKDGQTIDDNNKELLEDNIKRIFSLFKEKICPEEVLEDESRKMIKNKLGVFSCDELEEAIDNFSKSEWWMERNGFRGAGWFFKSNDKIRQWLKMHSSPKDKKETLRRGSHNPD